jgi:hypothetical protein
MGEGVDALLGHAATGGIPVRSTLGQTERRRWLSVHEVTSAHC